MNIGAASRVSALPVKTIRYYEDVNLIHPARRDNGYRDYSDDDVCKLRFLQHARGLGFTIEDCRILLSLYEDDTRASKDVKAIAESHLGKIEKKIAELKAMQATLQHLVENCHGDHRPDCPIIDGLAHE